MVCYKCAVEFVAKRPIILPARSHFVELIAQYKHAMERNAMKPRVQGNTKIILDLKLKSDDEASSEIVYAVSEVQVRSEKSTNGSAHEKQGDTWLAAVRRCPKWTNLTHYG